MILSRMYEIFRYTFGSYTHATSGITRILLLTCRLPNVVKVLLQLLVVLRFGCCSGCCFLRLAASFFRYCHDDLPRSLRIKASIAYQAQSGGRHVRIQQNIVDKVRAQRNVRERARIVEALPNNRAVWAEDKYIIDAMIVLQAIVVLPIVDEVAGLVNASTYAVDESEGGVLQCGWYCADARSA